MPANAKILTVQLDFRNGIPQLWALVNENAPIVGRKIHVIHTGEDAYDCGEYIATVQVQVFPEPWVAHFFEDKDFNG